MKDKKALSILKILVGLFILGTVLCGYHFSFARMYQLTFISNSSCGLLLITDGIVNLVKKKTIPCLSYLYLIVLLCTNTVLFTIPFKLFGWHDFNFRGGFFFMHAINPVVFLLMYLFAADLTVKDKRDLIRRVFISPVMVMSFLLLDLIKYFITDRFVYGLIPTESVNFFSVALIGVVFYLLMSFMSYGLLKLKLHVQKKIAA